MFSDFSLGGCIFYVVEIAYCQLIECTFAQSLTVHTHTFSQNAEINQSDFSTPIPRDKMNIWCIILLQEILLLGYL
jgi:hypothetical protein